MTQQEFFARFKFDLDADFLGGGNFVRVYKAFDKTGIRNVTVKVFDVKKGAIFSILFKKVEFVASVR